MDPSVSSSSHKVSSSSSSSGENKRNRHPSESNIDDNILIPSTSSSSSLKKKTSTSNVSTNTLTSSTKNNEGENENVLALINLLEKNIKLSPSTNTIVETNNTITTNISSTYSSSTSSSFCSATNMDEQRMILPPSSSPSNLQVSSSSTTIEPTTTEILNSSPRSGYLSIADNAGNLCIRRGTQSFKVLTLKSTVFVDKSLFIKDFLTGYDDAENMLVTYPRRWGKSMNLDMIKTFLQLEIDANGNEIHPRENDKLFIGGNISLSDNNNNNEIKQVKPLQISRYPNILQEYMGKYPVIYLNMQNIFSPTYDGIVNNIRLEIRDLYTKYEYLLHSCKLSSTAKDVFRTYLTGTVDDEERLKRGIKYLSEYLHRHHGKKVFILIDEYDAVVNHAFVESDNNTTISIVRLIGRLFQTTLKGNENVERTLITGIYRIAKSALFSELNNFVEIGLLDDDFAPYYGFTDMEVNQLLTVYGITSTFSQDIKNWYNGYTIGTYQIYNPWSIVNILSAYNNNKKLNNEVELQKKILKSYHEASLSITYLDNLFKFPEIRKKISDLVLGHPLNLTLEISITLDTYKVIKEILFVGSTVEITSPLISLIFSYLFAAGYLTICPVDYNDNINVEKYEYVRIPNNEMRTFLAEKILLYYGNTYSIDNSYFTNATDILQNLLNHPNSQAYLPYFQKEFTEKLNKLFSKFPKFEKLHNEGIASNTTTTTSSNITSSSPSVHGNEALLQMVIGYIAIQLNSTKKFGLEVNLGEGRTDVAFTDTRNTKAIIIELKYNSSATVALQQIKNKKYTSEVISKYPVIIVGINLDENKNVEVISEYIPQQNNV